MLMRVSGHQLSGCGCVPRLPDWDLGETSVRVCNDIYQPGLQRTPTLLTSQSASTVLTVRKRVLVCSPCAPEMCHVTAEPETAWTAPNASIELIALVCCL